MRIVQLEGLVGRVIDGIVVAVSSLGYFAAIGDGIVGVIQQGVAINDNRGLGTGNFIAAGDGDLVMVDVRLYTPGAISRYKGVPSVGFWLPALEVVNPAMWSLFWVFLFAILPVIAGQAL